MPRETKTHYRSRAGIEPLSRDDVRKAKKFILSAIDDKINEKWKGLWDNEKDALRIQRNRVAKLFGLDES